MTADSGLFSKTSTAVGMKAFAAHYSLASFRRSEEDHYMEKIMFVFVRCGGLIFSASRLSRYLQLIDLPR